MQRLWSKGSIQLGLLCGLGLGFVGTTQRPANADEDCPVGDQCTFKKPNFLVVMDYSSSMNEQFGPGQTRWEAAVEAVQNMITTNNGFFDDSMHIALMRFGHDPDPDNPGTVIAVAGQQDTSGIVDGQSLDVPWYDAVNDPQGYYECNGEAIVDFLDQVPPPLCVGPNCAGIGTWTRGALARAQGVIAQTRADHPEDLTEGDERFYAVLLMTDGVWTDVTGQQNATPPAESPVPVAGDLFGEDGVPVYVVAFGAAAGLEFTDEIATAGGTGQAISAAAGQLVPALEGVLDDIADNVIVPECTGGLPRVMVILDGSSSMLNVQGNAQPGAAGQTGWDQAREALAGDDSIFDIEVGGVGGRPLEDLVHLGVIVYGGDDPAEERILVNYNPCLKDNVEWALDPATSCGPGCADPWGGPPIIWTPQGPDSPNYPGFDAPTYSHMPLCEVDATETYDGCIGSGTFTHLGLELASLNAQQYRANPPPDYPVDDTTSFINILITDGQYTGFSTDAEVQSVLTSMHAQQGLTTYVIGFGDAPSAVELANMACWGSGGTGVPCQGGTSGHFTADNQAELQQALRTIVEGIAFDPCCNFNDCSFNPEPTTGEADPEPTEGDEDSSSTTGGDETSGDDAAGTTGAADDDVGDDVADDGTTTSDEGSSSSGPQEPEPPASTSAAEESSGGDDVGATTSDEGCGCSSGSPGTAGWLGLGVLGFAFGRGRRRPSFHRPR